ncbi:uncharacterized protein BXZ73DRAFT_99968 [Epithele typhae]|uniref:uncharacterized protein n=1 Tax=Epithele typhae TaxID=378194 RepID=UPI00200873AD|nr:uncharacterized protein BXZ73DRAFT_110047 [Epithele typhae]XP_047879538.1 uncharacterized protein BXZ73DRAFT_99968 [Epithele typhae]KAH9908225.1 hypothetical protein BXZ73DRAFT_110047 [Epithele typhae]KAH9938905.1 hypothetical protein BXZ73DRAFT_99968 [Epithele typhae]
MPQLRARPIRTGDPPPRKYAWANVKTRVKRAELPGSSIEDGLNPEFPRNGSAFFSGTAASGSGDWKWLLTEGGHHTTFGGKQGFTRWPSTPLYDGSGALASVVHQERGWAYVLFLRAGHLVPQGAPTAVFLVTPSFVSPPCVELPSAAGWR